MEHQTPLQRGIRRLRARAKLTQIQLAAKAGVSQPTVSDLERGRNAKSRELQAIAKALGVTVEDLFMADDGSRLEPTPLQRGIPLISWVAAGNWSEAFDPYAPGAAESWADVPGHHSKDAFALRVRGDSMEPRFPDGCVIIVEPHRQPRPGQFIVVRNNDWDEATFKQFDQDGAIQLLKPLNERYPVQPMPPESVLVGVVVRRYIDEPV